MIQTAFTYDRYLLLLEGLWDQLEIVATALRSSDEQANALQAARSRIEVYRIRLPEILAQVQRSGSDVRTTATQRVVASVLCELETLLESLPEVPSSSWLGVLYRAQDELLAALHELRHRPQIGERAVAAAFA